MNDTLKTIEATKKLIEANNGLSRTEANVLLEIIDDLYGKLYQVEQILDEYSRVEQAGRTGNNRNRGKQ